MVSTPFEYVRAEEHVLPYRVIFEELWNTGHDGRAVDGRTFQEVVQRAFRLHPTSGQASPVAETQEAAEALVLQRITDVEGAYRELAVLKEQRCYSSEAEGALNRLEAPLLQILHDLERTALCLSGGGIRSAALCLGALQALARFRNAPPGPHYDDLGIASALEEFDYLSTVSGGGYIGSWLTAWSYRVDEPAREAAARMGPAAPPRMAFHHVARNLAGDVRHTSADPAQRPVRHLREYTSFLAPRLGLTLDTFTLAAIVLRNLFVNWTMILPILFTVAAALQTLRLLQFANVGWVGPQISSGLWWSVAAVLFLAAGVAAGRRMPSSLPPMPVGEAETRSELSVAAFFVLPLFLASQALLRLWLNLGSRWSADGSPVLTRVMAICFCGLFSICAVRVWRQMRRRSGTQAGMQFRPGLYLAAGIGASALVSTLLGLCIYAVGAATVKLPELRGGMAGAAAGNWISSHDSLGAMFAFPVVWLLIMLASSLYSALLAAFEDDIDREWWARAGGLMMSVLLLWIVGIGLVAIAPDIANHRHALLLRGISLAGLSTGLLGALVGSSSAGSAGTRDASAPGATGGSEGKTSKLSGLGGFVAKHDLFLPLVCCLALLAAALAIAAAEAMLVERLRQYFLERSQSYSHTSTLAAFMTYLHLHPLGIYALLLLVFAVCSVLINLLININIFSLHGMYRMRLMRAFMGASNLQRLPNGFTGFDGRDNIEAATIRTGQGVPLHLINTTVNLVGTTNSSWRQRKAEGFTVSPLHSGGWRLGYARTSLYGGPRGLTLATAMAISGAAFNPNMGYHSSPLVTLLMTLFNVRLGWWLPNPKFRSREIRRAARKASQEAAAAAKRIGDAGDGGTDEPGEAPTPAARCANDAAGHVEAVEVPPPLPPLSRSFLSRRSPLFALRPLLLEALGGTNDEGAHIELTDGGHFENLGLYEMVMRRVHWIVVIDGSADAECRLEDLGNAMRKVEIDLGVPIVFRDTPLRMRPGVQGDNFYCALADVRYDIVDCVADPRPGRLLYIKAGLNGGEPPDVLQYARTHPTFPHETTANQFFTESQFESYRHLGQHEVSSLTEHARLQDLPEHKPLIRALFDAAEHYLPAAARQVPSRQQRFVT